VLLDPDSVAQSNFPKRHEIVAFQALPLKIEALFSPRPIQDHLGHASDLMLTLCFDPFVPEAVCVVSVGCELHLENSPAFIWAG
jgi:hypothetical protein